MSTYKEIKGFKVQTLATDTAASGISSATWASGGSLPAALTESAGAGVTVSAALNFGGQGNPPSPLHPVSGETDSYNGTSWTEVAELNTARRLLAGAGTQTAALAYGGWPPNYANTEEWNGSAWTEVADLNTAGRQATGVGVNAEACLMVAGKNRVSNVESWNGSSWSEIAEINTPREQTNNWGTSTSAVTAGGIDNPGAVIANVESWNGSAWTEIVDLNVGRSRAGTAGADNTEGLFFGGNTTAPALVASTEYFDGSSWTEVADLASAIAMEASAGHSAGNAFQIAGNTAPGTRLATTSEFVAPSAFSKINLGQVYYNSGSNAFKVTGFAFPTGTWASNTASPTATTERWGTGLSNSDALIQSPPGVSMEWNGSSWTNGGTTNFNGQSRGATGGISAALIWGGNPNNTDTEQYNGTAWTEVNDLNTGGNQQPAGPTGTYTNTITAGRGPGWQAVSESWNGSTWTETSDLNTARRALGSGGGSSTDAAVFGGNVPPNNASALTETWNGSAWTETTDLNTARFSGMGFGNSSQSVGYVGGGSYPALPPYNVKTEFFNGSTWTEVGDLANGRYYNRGGGTGASALTAGGYLASPSGGQSTENAIWTVDQDNLTITVS